MSSGSLSVLGDVYNQLAKQGRLFVPARAAREFAKNRNNELGNLIQNLKMRRKVFPCCSRSCETLRAARSIADAKDRREARREGWRRQDDQARRGRQE